MKQDSAKRDLSDNDLVQRLKARDKTAMEEVVRLHGAKLYGLALQIVRNEDDAQEVMQEALLAIWTKIGMFEGRSAFTSWVYRVTANVALMKLRRERKFEQNVPLETIGPDADVPVIQIPDRADSPDAAAMRGELGERVRAAIEALPEPYRTTVILSDVEELSLAEVAEATEVSIPAVKSRLHRGRLALRKVLEPYLKHLQG